MNPVAVTAVQAMVAPVVLITTAAILSGALLTMYGSVNDRMRAMDHERLQILTGADGTLLVAAAVPPGGRERLTQIDTQLPMLLCRHRLLHNAVLLIYAGVAVLVLSVIAIGVAVTGHSAAAGTACPDLGAGRDRDAAGRAAVRRAIDHHLDECDRLRGAAHPIARLLITSPAGHIEFARHARCTRRIGRQGVRVTRKTIRVRRGLCIGPAAAQPARPHHQNTGHHSFLGGVSRKK
jgi:Protein of unknown function (DUF2721)